MVAAYTYLFMVLALFLLLWLRHVYLVYKLNTFLLKYHKREWEDFRKQNPSWLRMESWPSSLAFTFYSRAAYNFTWRSKETHGNQAIDAQRRRIRRFVWELPGYLIVVMLVAAQLFGYEGDDSGALTNASIGAYATLLNVTNYS